MHKKKCKVSAVISLILISFLSFFVLTNSAYADYTISMTSSGAQSINVAPDTSGIGTSISEDAVTVTTTCPYGYNLSISTSVNDNKLYLNGDSSNNANGTYFNPSDGTTSLSSAPNTWGFYQDGSNVPTSSSVFRAVPAVSSAPAIVKSSSSTSDAFSLYYGVAVGNDLRPGSYRMIPDTNDPNNNNGTIVYYLTMAEECLVTKPYMQDMTKADLAELMPNDGDSTTLYDKRDENNYQITKINGNYWMTQNLRITGTISAAFSNFDGDDVNISAGDLTSGNSYTQARTHVGVDSVGGDTVWYNYCSVSAATVCSQTQVDATEDICPAGWKLPTQADINGITSYKDIFSPVAGGAYAGGSPSNTDRGFWWTTIASSGTNTYQLRYMNNALSVNNAVKTRGQYVRCIKGDDPKPPTSTKLYDIVAAQSKGTQTLAELRAAITADNSGVYEYNSSVFGTSSDASNDNKIYYYRGILDNTTGSYGSNGDNAAHPNTVVLSTASSKGSLTTSDTCWRIVRTTGSGGVKMIYQGKWTGSTCANSGDNTQVATKAFNGTSSDFRQIVRVGYTHNSTYATNTSQSGTIAQVFGSNSNPGANDTRSTIKEYIEDTWYANNMTNYTSKLEASAGYCNDRTMNTSTSWTTPLAESTTITSYGTSVQTYYFGAYPRNANTTQAPSLTCGNKYSQIDRSTVDLYRYVTNSTGVSNQLKYPAALLTADEVTFAGSGYSSTTPYHTNSYLSSGSGFWLLSPYNRNSVSNVYGFHLNSSGALNYNYFYASYGVRPAISLKAGSEAVSGTGTATDPWIVNPDPPTLYEEVEKQSKGTQTLAELRAEITTDNSGVYEYNSSVFGTSSDASNDNKIYYYRGILDNTTGSYGSDGDNAAHPNTVVLSSASNKSGLSTNDTCWRIVRTTGSGGVKMIYQGKWTGSTCANKQTAAQVTTKAFDTTANSSGKSIIGVGYTNNATYKSTETATAYSTLFGSNTSYSGNSTSSTMKTYIEGTWFTNINSYASKLEPSAGYCNDRSIRTSSSSTSVISDSTNINTPYATATSGNTVYYFGSYVRTRTTSDKPTLGCPRSGADLYTTSSASNGNKQLGKPAALLTADEAAFAGSGYGSSTTPYHANSYLRSGSYFWLMSPVYRDSYGGARGSNLYSSGYLSYDYVYGSEGVRPAISLTSGTAATSGTGTAADPWIVNP